MAKKKTRKSSSRKKTYSFSLIVFGSFIIISIMIGLGLVKNTKLSDLNGALEKNVKGVGTISGVMHDANKGTQNQILSRNTRWSHTVKNVENRILLVSFSLKTPTPGSTYPKVTSATYGGVPLRLYGEGRNQNNKSISTSVWYLLAPKPGTAEIKAAFSAPVSYSAYSSSWFNVHQKYPYSTYIRYDKPTITNIPAVQGEIIFDAITLTFSEKMDCNITRGPNQVPTYLYPNLGEISSGGSFKSIADSSQRTTSMSWTPGCTGGNNSTNSWAYIVGRLKPATVIGDPWVQPPQSK